MPDDPETPPRPKNAASLGLPQDRPAADDRADWWEFDDPFDDLQPSLLTASQIENYARVTGVIFPFGDEFLKGATYEVGIGGNAYSWDEDKKPRIISVGNQGQNGITLEPNSITFVETDVEFRLPQYIAIRFNLHIKLVHRGLLLGTGPIVDPGFRGKLLIPLHNLTSSPYVIKPAEKIIWVEFTKTLFNVNSARDGYQAKPADYRIFPDRKRWLEASEYLDKANGRNPIMSSISGFIFTTNRSVRETKRWVRGIGLLALIGLLVSVGGALYGSWSVYNNALSILKADEARRNALEARLRRVEGCLAAERRAPGTNSPRC